MSEFQITSSFAQDICKSIKANPFRPINKILYDRLYNEILSGKLNPERKLIESKIANSLGISRSPVRLALQELMANNILIKEHGDIHVKSITYTDTLMLYETRMAIEPQVARIVANRISDSELADLKSVVNLFLDVDKTKNENDYVHADTLFHKKIFEYSKNPYLINIYKSLEFPLACYRYQAQHLNYDKMTESIGIEQGSYHHSHIYEMLKLHAPLLAEEAMRNDIIRMYATLSRIEW